MVFDSILGVPPLQFPVLAVVLKKEWATGKPSHEENWSTLLLYRRVQIGKETIVNCGQVSHEIGKLAFHVLLDVLAQPLCLSYCVGHWVPTLQRDACVAEV